MNRQFITGTDLYGWFKYGAEEINDHRKYLNSINVFPVADGDTGSNLVMTLRAMVDKTSRKTAFNSMLHEISQTGLANARGNSGIIFAAYVNAMAVEAGPFEKIGLSDFAQVANRAVKGMYQAIDQPVEGTIISVIKDWATFLAQNHQHYQGFFEFFRDSQQIVAQSLEHTKEQLELLRKNNVVDSGAAGFLLFIQGINRFLASEPLNASQHEEQEVVEDLVDHHHTEKILFRYCTTITVEIEMGMADSGFVDRVKAELREFGDSLLVTTMERKLKIHIHTNTPELVVERLRKWGRILDQLVDDMELQNRILNHRVSPIGILTDSIADLSDSMVLEQQIPVLPLGLLLDDLIYLDKTTIRLKQLFQRMKTTAQHPTSSQPEPGRISQYLQWAADHFESLIVITVSSKMSGTYAALEKEANRLRSTGKKISVIDSLLNSGAQGLIVKAAVEARDLGLDHDHIVSLIQERIAKTKIYVCLNTLEYAAKGGRVPNTVGKIGNMLGVRPIMSIDESGKGIAFGAAFSQKGITSRIMKLVDEAIQSEGIEDYCIVHADNLALALEYKDLMRSKIGKEPAFITEISSIVAIHSGPGCVAVCFIKR